MYEPEIYCLMASGRPLSDESRRLLLWIAVDLFTSGKQYKPFSSVWGEGFVSTRGNSVCLGAIAGMMFTAKIATEEGETEVRYIVRTHDLEFSEDAEWSTVRSGPFKGGHPRQNAHLN